MIIIPLVRYGIATLLSLGSTGVFWLGIKYAEQHPSTRMYRTVPMTLTWAMGACTFYLLLQTILPFLQPPWFDTLGLFVFDGFAILVAMFFLRRARYIEDTAALLILLFALIVLTLTNIAETLPPPSSPPPIIAFYAAWCAVGSVFLFPCIWFGRWLRRRLGPVLLPLPAILQPIRLRRRSPGLRLLRPVEISIASAITATLLTVGLFLNHQLGAFLAMLPRAAGLMLFAYLLGIALHWGLRWLFLGKPLYSASLCPKASSVTVIAEPSDDQQEHQQVYLGPTAPDGSIPVEVQMNMNRLLQSGEAISIHYRFDNGLHGSQHLPSYCTLGWTNCRTCSCCQEASHLTLPVQRGED